MLVQFLFFGAHFVVIGSAGSINLMYLVISTVLLLAQSLLQLVVLCSIRIDYRLRTFSRIFVLASGITILQVAANPYVTILGNPKTASSRLTLTQAFNSLGTTIAPTLGGLLILSGSVWTVAQFDASPAIEQLAYKAKEAALVQGPYLRLLQHCCC